MQRIKSRVVKGNSHGRIGPSWSIGNKIIDLDLFGKEVPKFNLKGQTHVNTSFGGLISVSIIGLVLAYTSFKFSQLYTRADPFINETLIRDWYNQEDKIDLNGINFKFAFSMEGFYHKKNKNDPRYVRQYLRYIDNNLDGTLFGTSIPYHMCTEEDYKDFYPPSKRSKDLLQSIKDDPERGLYCIDDGYKMTINGRQPTNYTTFEILFLPCNVVNTWDKEPDPIADECVPDLKA